MAPNGGHAAQMSLTNAISNGTRQRTEYYIIPCRSHKWLPGSLGRQQHFVNNLHAYKTVCCSFNSDGQPVVKRANFAPVAYNMHGVNCHSISISLHVRPVIDQVLFLVHSLCLALAYSALFQSVFPYWYVALLMMPDKCRCRTDNDDD